MRIALIAPGGLRVPPTGWGATEETVWLDAVHLRRHGHAVDIFNSKAIEAVIEEINAGAYDFVHCHAHRFAAACTTGLQDAYALTAHHSDFAPMAKPESKVPPATRELFAAMLGAPANIVQSAQQRDLFLGRGYAGFLRCLPNAVETSAFRVDPRGNGRAICLAQVCRRKRQAVLAEAVRGGPTVDFVGPWSQEKEPGFAAHEHARYLGVWNKDDVYRQLSSYSCLVLISRSEGAPKVVLEALAAGVSVVVTEPGAVNLPALPFVTVLADREHRPEVIGPAIEGAIAGNADLRPEIAAWARDHIDYADKIDRYVEIIDEFLTGTGTGFAGR